MKTFNFFKRKPVVKINLKDLEDKIFIQNELIGKLTVENKQLSDSEYKSKIWLEKAKHQAGFNNNTSFDEVWKVCLNSYLDNKISKKNVKEVLEFIDEKILEIYKYLDEEMERKQELKELLVEPNIISELKILNKIKNFIRGEG